MTKLDGHAKGGVRPRPPLPPLHTRAPCPPLPHALPRPALPRRTATSHGDGSRLANETGADANARCGAASPPSFARLRSGCASGGRDAGEGGDSLAAALPAAAALSAAAALAAVAALPQRCDACTPPPAASLPPPCSPRLLPGAAACGVFGSDWRRRGAGGACVRALAAFGVCVCVCVF